MRHNIGKGTHCEPNCNPKTKFRQHFKDLLVKYPNVNVGYMGFPVGWENHPIWQNAK